jgi:N-acetylneuraminic acid mutarotase
MVEIRANNGGSTLGTLFQKNGRFSAVQKNDSIIFFTGLGIEKNKFDVYDMSNKIWLIGQLPKFIESAAIISVDNKVYIAGGKVNGSPTDEVWKLNF